MGRARALLNEPIREAHTASPSGMRHYGKKGLEVSQGEKPIVGLESLRHAEEGRANHSPNHSPLCADGLRDSDLTIPFSQVVVNALSLLK